MACALQLQRAPLAAIRLRIGVHTGEVELRDDGNYAGPTINRTARLRDLAHGGQTILSGATEGMVVDRLPTGAWLTDLGTHALRDLPRPERVVQLCHLDLHDDFPPLHTAEQSYRGHAIPLVAARRPVRHLVHLPAGRYVRAAATPARRKSPIAAIRSATGSRACAGPQAAWVELTTETQVRWVRAE